MLKIYYSINSRIPNDTEKLKQYAAENPDKMFVQKNSNHRGIKIEKLDQLDLKTSGSFVQEFVDDPFLSEFSLRHSGLFLLKDHSYLCACIVSLSVEDNFQCCMSERNGIQTHNRAIWDVKNIPMTTKLPIIMDMWDVVFSSFELKQSGFCSAFI